MAELGDSRRTGTTLRVRLVVYARRLLALGLVVALVAGSAAAGKSYLWCVPMQQTIAACCLLADGPESATREGLPSAQAECCDRRSIGQPPQGHAPGPPPTVPPAFLTDSAPPQPVADPAASRSVVPEGACPDRRIAIRAGPRSARDRCAALQVFRC